MIALAFIIILHVVEAAELYWQQHNGVKPATSATNIAVTGFFPATPLSKCLPECVEVGLRDCVNVVQYVDGPVCSTYTIMYRFMR